MAQSESSDEFVWPHAIYEFHGSGWLNFEANYVHFCAATRMGIIQISEFNYESTSLYTRVYKSHTSYNASV